jgi:hypothetical protein
MERQMYIFLGKLEGLDIGRQEVLNATEMLQEQNSQLTHQQNEFSDRFTTHESLIREAVQFCIAGLAETSKKTGNTVKLAKATDEAKQLVSYYKNVTGEVVGGIAIEEMIAEGRARQVGSTNDADFALKFLNG